jgi:hypothetical protein
MKSKIQSVLIPKAKSKLHAVNFPKVGFTLKQSHEWLKKHNYKIPKKVDETINFFRYRQKLPDKRYTYTTQVLPNGVELVLMWKKPKLEGGAKRQVYTPEPDKTISKEDLNRAIMALKIFKVFQLKEIIQQHNEKMNLNIKYKVARRDKLIESIVKFNINPNDYQVSQINPRQPMPTNILKKYGIKPNTEAEQKEYEDELSQVKTPYKPRQDKNKPAEVKNLLTLQDHQEKFIKQFIFSNLRGAIVYHGVGSGKTLTAVVSSYFYLLMYPTHKIVVISPSALLYNFINSMIQYGLNIADNRYKFLTYEKFVRNPIDPKTKKLLINKDTLVIIDEAHNFRTEIIKTEIRNPETDQIISTAPISNKRGFTIMEAGTKFAHKVLLLTGTPFVNTLYDIENLLSMIEKRDPLNKASYFNMLSVPENISDYFNYKISYFKSPQSEFFPEYKPQIIGIPMTQDEEEQYKQIKEVGKFEYNDDGEMVFTGKDSEKPNAYYSAERYATNAIGKENNPKIKMIIELIKEKPTQKFIIYSALQDAGVQLLKKALFNIKVEYVVISGSETTRAKEEARRNFNGFYSDTIPKSDDPLNKDYLNNRYRVLLITKAGTEGVDTQNCQNLILLDHQWNDATTEQIIARAIRFKSHHALPVSERYVNVYTLLFVFKSEMKYIKRLNEKGFNDYIGIKNEVNEQSLDYKQIQNKKTNSFNSLTNIKERLSESKLKGKTEEEIKKIVSSDFKKLINRFIENMPELKSDFEKIKNNDIDEEFNTMKKKQKINGLIEIGHKKQRQGIGKKWSADTRQEITVSKYVSSFIVEFLIEKLKDKINKKVDFGELDISNLDPSIDLRLFLLAKSKLKNINEFVSKIGNEISKFEKYESKLLPLIITEETKLKRSLTDEEQIQIYRNVLKDEIQDILKNSYVPPSELIGKQKRLTQDEKQQFYTSIELATEIADLGFDGLEGEIKILEPTAGNGGLIYPLVNNLIKNKDVIFKIDMIEIDEKNRIELKKLESDIIRLLDNRNFLTVVFKQMYDLILMNPPFNLNGKENGLEHNTYDWEFMRRAFACLKVGGSLVCISSKGWCNTTQLKRIYETFKIFGSDYDDYLNFNGLLNQNKEVKGSSEMANFKIIRKGEVKFKGSQGKDTGSGFEVDIFKIIKKSDSLDDKILNTVFYRQVDDTSAQLKVSDIDLDNLPKPPEPPKPEPPKPPTPEPKPTPEVILPEPIKAPVNTFETFSKRLDDLSSMGSKEKSLGYVASESVTTFSYAYLMDKYKSKCPIFKTYKEIKNNYDIVKTGIEYANKGIKAPEGLGKYLKNCIDRGEDLIVFPLMLPAHANLMVFRPFQKIIERYEPHGSAYGASGVSDDFLNATLKKYFEITLKDDLKEYTPRFKTPLEICSIGFIKGLQSLEGLSKIKKKLEGGGYCQIWSLFLLETILLNPTISTQEIIKNIMNISKTEPDYLLNLIRGYMSMLSQNIKELIKKLGDTFKNLSFRDKSIYDQLRNNEKKKIFNDYLNKIVEESLLRRKEKPELIPEKYDDTLVNLKETIKKEVKNISDDETKYLYYFLVNNKLKPEYSGYSASTKDLKKAIVEKLLELSMTLEDYSKKNKWLPKMGAGRKRKGGNIDNQELAQFVDAGYKTKSEAQNVDGYVLDKELSTKRDKVYYDPNTGKAVHTIAGTDKAKDWSNNLLIPLGLHQYSNRYKNAEKIQKKANEKYGKDNLSLVSHSQSGNIAQNLAKKKLVGDENITLNPAIIGSHNKKLKVVKSSGDVVSALTFTNKKDKVLKSKTWNPLTEHSTKVLTRKKK